jgi:hypothetical protein
MVNYWEYMCKKYPGDILSIFCTQMCRAIFFQLLRSYNTSVRQNSCSLPSASIHPLLKTSEERLVEWFKW